jgi:hypothetical protein
MFVGCTRTHTGTNFPWRVTVPDTTDIIIHTDFAVSYENTPGTLGECAPIGLNFRLTGQVTASFTPGTPRRIDFDGSTGPFIAHIPGVGSLTAVVRGQAVATGLLNIIM